MADVYEVNDEAENGPVMASAGEGLTSSPNSKLNPITQKVVEKCIQEIIGTYITEQKLFTADTIHYLRTKVTELVHQRLGDDEITSVDIGLDLTSLDNIPFFFKVNIPQGKVEDHILSDGTDEGGVEEVSIEEIVEEVSPDAEIPVEPADSDLPTEESNSEG